MKHFIVLLLIFLMQACKADERIISEFCLQNLYNTTEIQFKKHNEIQIFRDIRGIILRVKIKNPAQCYYQIDCETYKQLCAIKYFLSKIKNPVIIEVHTEKVPEELKMKNWEFASVIAGNIGEEFVKTAPNLPVDRIYTVGYGEYMPDINTSNNGGKSDNRIDIIILCSISGE